MFKIHMNVGFFLRFPIVKLFQKKNYCFQFDFKTMKPEKTAALSLII